MIGICGAYSTKGNLDQNHITKMNNEFLNNGLPNPGSISWSFANFTASLFYNVGKRQSKSSSSFESTNDTDNIFVVATGTVYEVGNEKEYVDVDELNLSREFIQKKIAHYGVNSLGNISGNWAAVIYNKHNKSLILARDTTGMQPMYYRVHDKTVYFSTHLYPLTRLGLNNDIDRESLARFLHFLYVPSPKTIYKDIHVVPVGKAVEINCNGVNFHAVGNMRYHKKNGIFKNEESINTALQKSVPEFENLLVSAVKKSTFSQGRTGILLSGGKDSSALCVAAAKINPDKYLAITLGFDDKNVDESEDGALVAKHLGIEHRVYRFTPSEYIALIKEYARVHAQPFGDMAGIQLFLATKKLNRDVEVLLDGSGNGLYMGAPALPKYDIYLKLRFLHFIIRLFPQKFISSLPGKIGRIVQFFSIPIQELFVSWNGWSYEEINRIFGWNGKFEETEIYNLSHSKTNWTGIELNTEILCNIWDPNAAYRKVTSLADYSGIPVKFPFIDSQLVNYFHSLPKELCYSGVTNKLLLRKYLSENLPDKIINKPKGSFCFDTGTLLNANNYLMIREYLSDNRLNSLGVKDVKALREMINNYMEGNVKLGDRIFALFLVSLWFSEINNSC